MMSFVSKSVIDKRVKGFTLIEVMIVVAIVAILAGIAYPSYQESVNKGRRAEATAALLEGAQALERYYSSNGRYTEDDTDDADLAPVFPTQVPASGTARYTIAATAQERNSYTLQATPTGAMANDKCGSFVINHAGVRDIKSEEEGKVPEFSKEQCWRQ